MRPLSPFCGTVLNAQLLTLPATISTRANGVVTTQLSFLPPASRSATDVPASSVSLPATAQPPEPPPTTTKSNVSLKRVSPVLPASLRFCALAGKAGSGKRIFERKQAFSLSQNPQKSPFFPFQSGRALIHTPRTRRLSPGSPSQEASGHGPIGAFARWPGFASGSS